MINIEVRLIKMEQEEVIIKFKQFVIVPKKPRMSKGKIASQVAHATFRALDNQKDKKIIKDWKCSGMCVIVLQCKNQTELLAIGEYLKNEKVPYALIVDEGLTEIPMGTVTSLATGVLPESEHWRFGTMGLFK